MSITALALMLLGAATIYLGEQTFPENNTIPIKPKIDDWQYSANQDGMGGIKTAINTVTGGGMARYSAPAAISEGIGFSTGGAKDINNFRENIENGYLPIHTDLTYEGLYYDYYFDTGEEEPCNELFCPSYIYTESIEPFTEEVEYYMTVGLNSGLKEEDFERKKLNLVIVLDVSGSMSSPFNKYYYDQFGNRVEVPDEEYSEKTKMELAKESVIALTEHLEGQDRFGMVVFNNGAQVAKPLSRVDETDMDAIREHIREIQAGGGTNMESGMREGTDLFDKYMDIDQNEYENRIIFLTDAMPNLGELSRGGLGEILEDNADDSLHTTFIGIGVDFNTDLIESITKIRGANYYSVHSAKQFEERMDEGFDFMVTPLVFDLKLELEAEGWEIEKVYGSPEADESTGTLMHVNTLFPSKKEDGETKGGVVLLKLKKTGEGDAVLKVSYEDREGNEYKNEKEVEMADAKSTANTGLRKAILLARYGDMMKNWVIDERENLLTGDPEPIITREEGIIPPPFPEPELGQWERQSTPLQVSEHYEELFEEFADYFEEEMDAIGDESLEQELDLLEKLA